MNKYCYKYPRPSLTADILLLATDEQNKLKILLIQRKNYPFENMWALPGGFIDPYETIENTAYRELKEETGIDNINLDLLTVMSDPDRDPRGRTVSVVFWAVLSDLHIPTANDDAKDVKWFDFKNIPKLAFDHNQIINIAKEKLIYYITNNLIKQNFINKKLTIEQLISILEQLQ